MKELFVAIIFIIFGKIYCRRYSYKNVNLKKDYEVYYDLIHRADRALTQDVYL